MLRSWALPKGLPTDPSENRLAVEVADHAMEHLRYTDTDKSIADIGWWEEHDRNERRMIFTLHGQGVPRRYALIRVGARTGGAGSRGREIRTDQNWLLHQMKDA